jgi:hypothetical protein
MGEHILVRPAPIPAQVMEAQWFQEQGCLCRIWSLCNFIHLGFMALAYVNEIEDP